MGHDDAAEHRVVAGADGASAAAADSHMWFYELLDIRNRIHTEDVVAGALTFSSNGRSGTAASPFAARALHDVARALPARAVLRGRNTECVHDASRGV